MVELSDTVPGDEKAIIGPSKIERKGKDGTTVVFYSFPKGGQLKQIKRGDTLTLVPEKPIFVPYTLSPASDEVRKNVESTHRQIEGIADIKFYDLGHLSAKQRAELIANGITIPKVADTPIYQIENYTTSVGGISSSPGDEDKAGLGIFTSWMTRFAAPGDLNTVMMHETMHTLGFMHSFREEDDGGKPALGELDDYFGNTVMSYTRYDRYGTPFMPKTYQEMDVAGLQKVYGPSKNPTPNLQENLAKEEREQKANAHSNLPTVIAERKADKAAVTEFKNYLILSDQARDDLAMRNYSWLIDESDIKYFLTMVELGKQKLTPDQRKRVEKHYGADAGDVLFSEVKKENGATTMRVTLGYKGDGQVAEAVSIVVSPEGMKYLSEHSVREGNNYRIAFTPNPPKTPAPAIAAPEDQAPSVPTPAVDHKPTPISGGKPEDKFFGLNLPKPCSIGFEGHSSLTPVAADESKAPLPTEKVTKGPAAILG